MTEQEQVTHLRTLRAERTQAQHEVDKYTMLRHQAMQRRAFVQSRIDRMLEQGISDDV